MKEKVDSAIVVKSIEKQAKPFFNRLNKITVIRNKEEYELAVDNLKSLKEIKKIAEEEERDFREPIKALEAKITQHFKPFKDSVIEADRRIKELMAAFNEKAEKEILKLENSYASGKIKKGTTLMVKKSEFEGIGNTKKKVVATCKDLSKTPREYLVPDESAILSALKSGKKVNGWILETKKIMSV